MGEGENPLRKLSRRELRIFCNLNVDVKRNIFVDKLKIQMMKTFRLNLSLSFFSWPLFRERSFQLFFKFFFPSEKNADNDFHSNIEALFPPTLHALSVRVSWNFFSILIKIIKLQRETKMMKNMKKKKIRTELIAWKWNKRPCYLNRKSTRKHFSMGISSLQLFPAIICTSNENWKMNKSKTGERRCNSFHVSDKL